MTAQYRRHLWYQTMLWSGILLFQPVSQARHLPSGDIQAVGSAPEAKGDLQNILERMAEHRRMRDKILQTYAVDRVYRVENKRVNKQAMVKARMFFVAPEEKLFEVQSYSGSDFMRKGVLNRLIETERQSAPGRIQEKTAISPDNYDFQLLRQESVKNRPQYVLRAKPRQKEGLLFDGIIWVDAVDYAVTRIEARPAKNPSFWTRKVNFVQEYGKFDALWFPMRNTSVASVFIFGNTTTEIEYGNYQINRPELLEQAAEVRKRGAKLEIKVDAKDKRSGNQ